MSDDTRQHRVTHNPFKFYQHATNKYGERATVIYVLGRLIAIWLRPTVIVYSCHCLRVEGPPSEARKLEDTVVMRACEYVVTHSLHLCRTLGQYEEVWSGHHRGSIGS